jgi:hypothetical protein
MHETKSNNDCTPDPHLITWQIPSDQEDLSLKHFPGIWILDMIESVAKSNSPQDGDEEWTRRSKR